MSGIAGSIDAVITAALGEPMKSAGFRKSGRNFRRAIGDGQQILNVQASTFNASDSGRFTVNLGAYFPSVAELLDKPLGKSWPTEYQCHLRQRIGMLMPCRCDWWWELDSSSDCEVLAGELRDAAVQYALPWLDRVSTLDGALEESANVSPVTRATFAIALGRQSTAVALFEPLLHANPPLSDEWMSWARRHRLIEA